MGVVTSRARVSDEARPIRFSVVSPTCRAAYEMPRTDRPIADLCGLPAHMLDGATLYVDGATSLRPGGISVEPVIVDKPKQDSPKRRAA